eukprot:CAMPEP_0176309942 /NCGR_PEP_ID=MMETSP0121_2-20121125/65339_1 /TAXON_ID=160619 /ORGANISM="Kryptoperidinium foliaceum, Strain CCMP 1326" /LENGTH=43 /DNA_ID= /DNA_START= /DNA_END= /DNA_ORIENTATION=
MTRQPKVRKVEVRSAAMQDSIHDGPGRSGALEDLRPHALHAVA